MNRVYFLGAGPGDPELLTLRAARLLADCALVYAPQPFEVTFASHLQGKEVRIPFEFYFAELIEQIKAHLDLGNVAFLVPGDLTFYSPFQALVDHLGERAVVVPGVGTANAAAAHLKRTFDLPDVCNRAIIASPRTLGVDGALTLRQLAAPGVTLLIYMNNLPLPELVDQLRDGYGENVPIVLLHRLGLPGEVVVNGTLDTITGLVGERDFFNLNAPDRRPALTLVVAGKTLDATVDGAWWDYRRDHIWRFRSEGDA
jgi:precorrin-4/cobalt-precorrin-4 C11-methyltransferase